MGDFVLPRDSGDAHSFLYIGMRGYPAPGFVRDLTIKRALDADLKKPAGKDGMTPTTNGEHPVDVNMTLEWWDDPGDPDGSRATMASVGLFITSMFPEGKAPAPRDVAHPKLALHNIRSLFFLECEGPIEIGYSHWQLKLKAVNFRPLTKKNATNSPKTSAPVAQGNKVIPPGGGGWKDRVVAAPKDPTRSKPKP